jgi:hypothetical protein
VGIKHGRKLVAQPVTVRVSYNPAARSVTLRLARGAAFTRGGQIILNSRSPDGITDAGGIYLDGTSDGVPGENDVLVVSHKAIRISLL